MRAEKLVVLGLHGYLQSGESFRSRIGSVRKGLKSRVGEFVFPDAPFPASVEALGGAARGAGAPGGAGDPPGPSPDPEEAERAALVRETGGLAAGGRSWWTWDAAAAERPSQAKEYRGIPEAMRAIAGALNEARPDGVVAFSQGASAAAVLLSALSPGAAPPDPGAASLAASLGLGETHLPKFCVLVGGFLPNDERWAGLVRRSRPTGVSVLVVSGQADELVPPARTADLAACFDPAWCEEWSHPGGHMVPTGTGEFKRTLLAFIDGAVARAGGEPAGAPAEASA